MLCLKFIIVAVIYTKRNKHKFNQISKILSVKNLIFFRLS